MASPLSFFILCTLLLFISPSIAEKNAKTKSLVLPVAKDAKTLQYVTRIMQRTPLVPVKLTIDVGGRFLWVDCEKNFVSSSFKSVPCDSALCKLSGSGICSISSQECVDNPKLPGCSSTCGHLPNNPVTGVSTSGDFGQDVVSLPSSDGFKPGPAVTSPDVMVLCAANFLLEGLASGVNGIAGLGLNQVSLPSQFSRAFNVDRKFAICLPSETESNGVVFFGGPPYGFPIDFDMSSTFQYTPLIKNPVSTTTSFEGESSAEYFVTVTSIKLGGEPIQINKTLLIIDKEGHGGTKFSTATPYTTLETSIYKAFVRAFLKKMGPFKRVPPVKPFEICYSTSSLPSLGYLGPSVPFIDFILHDGSTTLTIYGRNSMVKVGDKYCLGFVDGGVEPTTSVVFGGFQMEDMVFQFDIANKRLGFSGTIHRFSCSSFNLTSSSLPTPSLSSENMVLSA